MPGALFEFNEQGANYYNTLELVVGKSTIATTISPAGNQAIRLDFVDSNRGESTSDASFISRLAVIDKFTALAINIGDLGSVGIQQTLIDVTGGNSSGGIVLETSATGSSTLLSVAGLTATYPDPRDQAQNVTEQGLAVVNEATGTTTDVLGLTNYLDIRQHGGTADIGNLGSANGLLFFDVIHDGVLGEDITLTTPSQANGSTVTTDNDSTGFRIRASGNPDVVIFGLASDDTTTLDVSPPDPGATNTIAIDASAMVGRLNINDLGSQLVNDNLTVSNVTQSGLITIDGENSTTTVTVGVGQLALIQGSVSVARAALSIDDRFATAPSILTMDSTTFKGWNGNSASAKVTYSDLPFSSQMSIFAGPGDAFDLEETPVDIHNVTFDYSSLDRASDAVYIAQMANTIDSTVPLVFDGGFALFLGERLAVDGTVTRLSSLHGLSNTRITYNATPAQELRIYPDSLTFWNPTGQSYSVSGNGDIIVTEAAINLIATINRFRNDDAVVLDMPGGSVDADLTKTGAGTISLDGSSRLLGTNVSAPLNVTVHARAGVVTMQPTGANNSVLRLFNTLNLLGTRPQDSVDVYDSDSNLAFSNDAIPAPYAQFSSTPDDPTTVTVGQSFDFAVVAEDAEGAALTAYDSQVQWYAYNQATGEYVESEYESFLPSDQGQHLFQGIVLSDAGTYSLGFDDGWNANSFTITALTSPQGGLHVEPVGDIGTPNIAAAKSDVEPAADANAARASAPPDEVSRPTLAVEGEPVTNVSLDATSAAVAIGASNSVETAPRQTMAAIAPSVDESGDSLLITESTNARTDRLTVPRMEPTQSRDPLTTVVSRQSLPDIRTLAAYCAVDPRMNPSESWRSVAFHSTQAVVVVHSFADPVATPLPNLASSESIDGAGIESHAIHRARLEYRHDPVRLGVNSPDCRGVGRRGQRMLCTV